MLAEENRVQSIHETVIAAGARELARTIDATAAAAEVTAAIMREVWPEPDDTGFREAVHLSVEGNVRSIISIIGGELTIEDAEPEAALALAEITARLDVPLSDLDRAYRIGVARLWEMWFNLAREHAEAGGGDLGDLISGPTVTMLRYIDHILSSVNSRHDETRSELNQTRRHLRRLTLMQILDGTIDHVTDELNGSLDYSLSDTHLALLLESDAGQAPDAEIIALRDAADARSTLVLQHGVRSWLVWLGRPGPFGVTQLSRLRRAMTDSGLTIAVGEPAPGLPGLRSSRQQVIETARVQHALGEGHRCLWASEVRLEAMLLSDETRARAFVAAELGRLSASDTIAERLRETLLAWLATGSHVNAAAVLGVHENTVRNRIRQAEALLDASVLQRRTELQVALRLERVLKADALAREPAEAAVAAAVA
jgi:hypothetical protein